MNSYLILDDDQKKIIVHTQDSKIKDISQNGEYICTEVREKVQKIEILERYRENEWRSIVISIDKFKKIKEFIDLVINTKPSKNREDWYA